MIKLLCAYHLLNVWWWYINTLWDITFHNAWWSYALKEWTTGPRLHKRSTAYSALQAAYNHIYRGDACQTYSVFCLLLSTPGRRARTVARTLRCTNTAEPEYRTRAVMTPANPAWGAPFNLSRRLVVLSVALNGLFLVLINRYNTNSGNQGMIHLGSTWNRSFG